MSIDEYAIVRMDVGPISLLQALAAQCYCDKEKWTFVAKVVHKEIRDNLSYYELVRRVIDADRKLRKEEESEEESEEEVDYEEEIVYVEEGDEEEYGSDVEVVYEYVEVDEGEEDKTTTAPPPPKKKTGSEEKKGSPEEVADRSWASYMEALRDEKSSWALTKYHNVTLHAFSRHLQMGIAVVSSLHMSKRAILAKIPLFLPTADKVFLLGILSSKQFAYYRHVDDKDAFHHVTLPSLREKKDEVVSYASDSWQDALEREETVQERRKEQEEKAKEERVQSVLKDKGVSTTATPVKKDWREVQKEKEASEKAREEEEARKREEKIRKVEQGLKQKGGEEEKDGSVRFDKDVHNPSADYARTHTKNAGWKERSAGQKSYLPPNYETWTSEQVGQWLASLGCGEDVKNAFQRKDGKVCYS